MGCEKARSLFPGCKLTLPHCCCWQNTYTNADKLLEAAEQLAQTGECDPEEIYKAARHLEVRIQDFVRRVEQRKLLLDMSVSFHTHTKEVRGERLCSPPPPGGVSWASWESVLRGYGIVTFKHAVSDSLLLGHYQTLSHLL